MPKDWEKPEIVQESYGTVKIYADGVKVIVMKEDLMDGYLINPRDYETRYPDRGLHYEHGYDEDGELTGRPVYFSDGIPEV